MLKESIARFLKVDNILENVTGYVETRLEIMKYDLKADASRLVSKVAIYFGLLLLFGFFLFFITIAVAFLLAPVLGYAGSFALVSAFYMVPAVLLFVSRNTIAGRIEKGIKEKIIQPKK